METHIETSVGLSKAERRQKWITMIGFLGPMNALMVFDRIALIVVTPILTTQLHLTLVETSVLISAVMWSYALLQIPAGWCVSRFGVKIMMFLALLLWSSATLITPLAPTFLGLVVVRVVLGLGQAPDWPASVAAVRSWFGPTERSTGTSILLAGQYLGAALAAPVTTAIVSRMGWKAPFYLYGAVGLVLTALWLIYFRERRSQEDGAAEETSKVRAGQLFAYFLRSRQFWCLGATYFCMSLAACFINYMLPHYLIETRHVKYETMGWLVGLPSVFLWVSVLLAAAIADGVLRKTGSVWSARVPLGCLGCIVAGCATGAIDWVPGIIPVISCVCLSFFGMGFAQVTLWSMAQDLTKNFTGVLTGWASAWGNLAAAAGPILIAEVVQHSGSWKLGLTLPIVAGCLGAVMIWGTRPHIPIPTVLVVQKQ